MVDTCTLCDQLFESLRGLNIHQAHCKFKQVVINRTNQDVITEEVSMNENIVVENIVVALHLLGRQKETFIITLT